MDRERGQATVELVAALPALLLAALIAFQLLLAGYALTLADGAAEAGALALPRAARRCRRRAGGFPAGRADDVEVAVDGGRVTVRLRPPSLSAAIGGPARGNRIGVGEAAMSASLLVVRVGGADGARAAAAALACAGSEPDRAGLLVELDRGRRPRPALVATAPRASSRSGSPPTCRRPPSRRGEGSATWPCRLTRAGWSGRARARPRPRGAASLHLPRTCSRRRSGRRARPSGALLRADLADRPRPDRARRPRPARPRPQGRGPSGRSPGSRPGGRCSVPCPRRRRRGCRSRSALDRWRRAAEVRGAPGRAGAAARDRRLLRPDRRGPGPGRDRGRRDRQGQGAAGGRPGGDLGRALDARRPAAAALAPDPPERPAQPRAHGQSDLPVAGPGGGHRRGRGQRGRDRAAAGLLSRRALLRAGPGEGGRARRAGGGLRTPRGLGRRRSGGAGRRPALDADRGSGGGYPARSSTGRGRGCAPTSPRRSTGWRPPPRRAHPDRQLGLPLRRRTGGAVRRQSRPSMGRAAGPLAAPLRDRARPRSRIGLRLARRQRRPRSASSSDMRGRPGTTASRARPRRARQAGDSVAPGRATGASPGAAACRASSRRASGRRCSGPPPAGTSPPRCSPRS